MKFKYIYLFVILVLGLLLSTFLGSYHSFSDSEIYNEGFSNILSSNIFYSPIGDKLIINSITNSGLTVTSPNVNGKELTLTFPPSSNDPNNNSFTAEGGYLFTLNTLSNGQQTLTLTNSSIPDIIVYTQNNPNSTTTSSSSSSSSTFTGSSFLSDLMSGFNSSSDSFNKSKNISSSSNYDNYNHFTGTSYANKFYGPNGSTARIIQTGNETVIVGTGSNSQNVYFYLTDDPSQSNSHTFLGPNGLSAMIIPSENGKQQIQFKDANGNIDIFTEDNIALGTSLDLTLNNNSNSSFDLNHYNGTNNGMNGAQGNSAAILPSIISSMSKDSNKNENKVSSSNYNYSSSLPNGIPASQIPPGQEDLYILKSQVVPPVCPICPEPIVQCPNNFDAKKCPPCPPCARCPEPAFDCKKVPNYNAFNPNYLPVPVLNDFTGFGM